MLERTKVYVIYMLLMFTLLAPRVTTGYLIPALLLIFVTLRSDFIQHFKSTCKRPGTVWELRACRQRVDENIRGYIQRWTIMKNNAEDISADPAEATSRSRLSSVDKQRGCRAPLLFATTLSPSSLSSFSCSSSFPSVRRSVAAADATRRRCSPPRTN